MYLTYTQYQAMGGTLTETVFNEYEFEAEAFINYATFNRLIGDTTLPTVIPKLTKYIIDMVQKKADSLTLGGGSNGNNGIAVSPYITAQSNDGVSVTYNGMATTDVFTLCNDNIQKTIKMYLQGVTNEAGRLLLYRGLYRGE